MKKVFFVDEPEQVDWLLGLGGGEIAADEILYVGTNPSASLELRRKGLNPKAIEDYFPSKNYLQKGMDHFDLVRRFCREMDIFLVSASETVRRLNLEPASYHFSALKVLFDGLRLRAMEISALLESERPDEIWCFETVLDPIGIDGFFSNNESLYSRLIPVVALARGLSAHIVPSKGQIKVPRGGTPFPKRFLQIPSVRLIRNLLRLVTGEFRIRHLTKFQDKPYLLTLNMGYDFQYVLKEILQRRSFNVICWDAPGIFPPRWVLPISVNSGKGGHFSKKREEELLASWDRFCENQTFGTYFQVQGVNLFPVFERYLKHFFLKVIPIVAEVFEQTNNLLLRRRLSIVFAPGLMDPRHVAIFEACRRHGVRRVIYSHGPYGFPRGILVSYTDYQRTDFFMAWGRGAETDVRKFNPKQPRVVKVGSCALDHLQQFILKRHRSNTLTSPTVLYVPFGVIGNYNYVTTFTDKRDHFVFKKQQMVLDAFSRFPHVRFIIKLFPNGTLKDPIKAWAEDLKMGQCLFEKWKPFAECLAMSDVVVTDHCSTPLIQSLAIGKRVILLRADSPEDENIPGLEQAVFVVRNVNELEEKLKEVLGNPKLIPLDQKGSLLKDFGTHLGDGRSVERACHFLEEIAILDSGNPIHEGAT
jgi:hypothetical protein